MLTKLLEERRTAKNTHPLNKPVNAVVGIFHVIMFVKAWLAIFVKLSIIWIVLYEPKRQAASSDADEAFVCFPQYSTSGNRRRPILCWKLIRWWGDIRQIYTYGLLGKTRGIG